MVKPLPSIHEQALTRTDQHLQGENILNGNISEDHYEYLASEKELATSANSVGIPSTFVTRFLARTKYGLWILIATKILVVLTVTLGVLGGLGYLSPHFGSDLAVSAPSVGATKYPGTSNGTATPGHFDMSGSGDGTYYGIVKLFLLNFDLVVFCRLILTTRPQIQVLVPQLAGQTNLLPTWFVLW
jgi:hypothetical protein